MMYVDRDGHMFMLVTAAIGAVVGSVIGGIHSYVETGSVDWGEVAV